MRLVCRALQLRGMEDEKFVGLGSPQLKSFSGKYLACASMHLLPLRHEIAAMTALTRLEMINFRKGEGQYRVWGQQLQNLRELVLVGSPYLVNDLIVDGSMTALQRLHLVGDPPADFHAFPTDKKSFYENLANLNARGHWRAQQLHNMGSTVLRLPSLTQVSGNCSLITYGMDEGLQSWKRCKYIRGCITQFDEGHANCMWSKF